MDSNHEQGQDSSTKQGHLQSSTSNSSSTGGNSGGLNRNDSFAHELLAGLATSFQEEHGKRSRSDNASTGGNPLLARLNQNSAERAHIAAVGHQLGPEGTKAPQVIGDYVGLGGNTGRNGKAVAAQSSKSSGGALEYGGTGLDYALENIRLGGEDDEVNELDAEDYEDDENMTMDTGQNLNQGSSVHGPQRMTEAMRAEAISAASAVDPRQLIGAAGDGYAMDESILGCTISYRLTPRLWRLLTR